MYDVQQTIEYWYVVFLTAHFVVRKYFLGDCFLPCVQAFNGGPCSEAKGGRKVCVHTHVVALAVKPSEEQGAAVEGVTTSEGDDVSDDDIFASAVRAYEKGGPVFVKKIMQLLKIAAVYLFPVDPLPHLPRIVAPLPERFTCFEKTCTRCGKDYSKMPGVVAAAVKQVRHPRTARLLDNMKNTVLWPAHYKTTLN